MTEETLLAGYLKLHDKNERTEFPKFPVKTNKIQIISFINEKQINKGFELNLKKISKNCLPRHIRSKSAESIDQHARFRCRDYRKPRISQKKMFQVKVRVDATSFAR